MTPPTTAPPTATAPEACPVFSTSRTSSTTAHSRQIAATTTGGAGGTAAWAATRGGSDLATGFGLTAGWRWTGFACSGCAAGCSGAWATGVLAAPGVPTEVGIQPTTAPIPTRLNSVIAIAAMMTRGWV